MAVEMQQQEQITVVRVRGEVRGEASQALKHQLQAAVRDGKTVLLVSLADVAFMDSAGLGALVSGLKAVRLAGGDLALCGVQPAVRTLFEITMADRIFELHPDEAAAMARLAAGRA